MKRRTRVGFRLFAAVSLAMLTAAVLPLHSQQAATMGGSRSGPLSFRMDNGLDIIVFSDGSTDPARTELVFRGGASAQTKDNAGVFNLLSQLILGSAAPFEQASSPSCQVGTDRFVIGLSARKEELDEAFGFLREISDADRIAAAVARESALAQAREAAVFAAHAASADPAALLDASVNRKLFGKYPWRRELTGQEKTLAELPGDTILAAARAWFVPNNALLVVTGDVDGETVRDLAEKAFGSWKKAPDPLKQKLPVFPKPGVTRPTWLARQDPSIPVGTALVDIRYRGPDPDSEPQASRAAQLWAELADNPSGRLVAALAKSAPGFLKTEPIVARYVPEADSSWITLSASLKSDNAASRAQQFKEVARNTEMYAMKSNASYFKPDEYADAKNRLIEARTRSFETPEGAAKALEDAWILWSLEEFIAFPSALAKIGSKDIISLSDNYFMKNLEVVSLGLNPADYAKQKKSLSGNGFEEVSQDKAFWWQK